MIIKRRVSASRIFATLFWALMSRHWHVKCFANSNSRSPLHPLHHQLQFYHRTSASSALPTSTSGLVLAKKLSYLSPTTTTRGLGHPGRRIDPIRLWEATSRSADIAFANYTGADSSMEDKFLVADKNDVVLVTASQRAITSAATIPVWPCLDALDKRLIAIAVPVICNFFINPLIGAVDLFWVNRMGLPLAVAGQAAANQVFNSVFWISSFLPSVTAMLISKENAKKNKEGVQDAVCQALLIGTCMALISNALLFWNPTGVLSSVLKQGVPAMEYAKPYLIIRAFAFFPSIISLVGFSAFRGVLDTVTPVKISLFANVFNAILDPILIFTANLGVTGAAIATLVAEVISAVVYLVILRQRHMLIFSKLFRLPSWRKLQPLLKGGAALQLRNVALNLTFLSVARVTQSIDSTGIAASAHAMAIQTFQLGGTVLLALSTVAQTVVPNDLVEKFDVQTKQWTGGLRQANSTVNRLMAWGVVLGIGLGLVQLAALPLIRQSTPLQQVRDAARIPSILASIFQVMNGLVFIGEGIMVGTGSFIELSLSTLVATAGCLWALRTFPPVHGVTGVWMSFGVFNVLRLTGVALHQRLYGPLSPKKMRQHDGVVLTRYGTNGI